METNLKRNLVKTSLIALAIVFYSCSGVSQSDRATTFGLKGNVTKVESSINDVGDLWSTYNLEFSKEGKLTIVNQVAVESEDFGARYTLERDENNRIAKVSSVEGDGLREIEYIYSTEGQLVEQKYSYVNEDTDEKMETGTAQFVYDADGWLTTIKYTDAETKKTENITYSYKKFDDNGNWVLRTVNYPSLGLNNAEETRSCSYESAGAANTISSTAGVQKDTDSVWMTIWRVVLAIIWAAILGAPFVYIIYVLCFKNRKIVLKTSADFEQYREKMGLPLASTDEENETVLQMLDNVRNSLTPVVNEHGETELMITSKQQMEDYRNVLLQIIEIALTNEECINEYNKYVDVFKMLNKRQFTGSKTYLIIGSIVVVLLLGISGGMDSAFILVPLGYYFASRKTYWMIYKQESSGKDNSNRSKLMTALTLAAFGIMGSGRTYKTVTHWSDGTTTTDRDYSEHFIALLIGFILLALLALAMFIVALVNFFRNYVLYK